MSVHKAQVSWRSDGNFTTGRYSRAHELRFDGGAVVRGSSSQQVVPLPMSDPAGVDPDEALVAATSACHMLWFLNLAQVAGHDVLSYEDEAEGVMGRIEGRLAVERIVLRPKVEFAGEAPSPDAVAALHHEAHERCFVANSLKSEVVVEARA
jgi:organic hydroperoxide reductase OsmC/OhrA